MKKKHLVLLFVCALALACGLSLYAKTSYSRVLEANWGISLPFKARNREVFSQDNSGFHGDGIRYHVYRYQYEDYIDLMFAWRNREGATIFHDSYSKAAEAWLDELQVPRSQRPSYEVCSYWYKSQEDHSELLIFWNPENNHLYILESFL